MREVLGCRISLGAVRNLLGQAVRRAGVVNAGIELSAVRVGLHDEIFQGPHPVLAGVDANSTFRYLLAAETQRDADTCGVHLLDAKARGLKPEFTHRRCLQERAGGPGDRAEGNTMPRRHVPHPARVREPGQRAGPHRSRRSVACAQAAGRRRAVATEVSVRGSVPKLKSDTLTVPLPPAALASAASAPGHLNGRCARERSFENGDRLPEISLKLSESTAWMLLCQTIERVLPPAFAVIKVIG